jgi:hypothetical protein
MKRILLLQAFLIAILVPSVLHAHFERATLGTRSIALGGMFIALGDDPSTLFANPSGLVTIESPSLYGEFAESPGSRYEEESRIAAIYPFPRFTVGAGWYRRGIEVGGDEDLIIAGIAATLLTNTQGSFLSVGAAAKIGRLSYESSCDCAGSGASQTETAFDLGVMFRPLPVISIAYSLSNVQDIDIGPPGEEGSWERSQRWGIAYFWEERVTVGYEHERACGQTVHHYGFSVRTSVPVELLAGFSEEQVYGGVRWVGERLRLAVSFGPDGDDGIYTSASAEIVLGFGSED